MRRKTIIISIIVLGLILVLGVCLNTYKNRIYKYPVFSEMTYPTSSDINDEYYGYNKLSKMPHNKNLLKTYKLLYYNIQNLNQQISLCQNLITLSEDEMNTVFKAFMQDYPEAFWVENKYTAYGHLKRITTIQLYYNVDSIEELYKKQSTFKQVSEDILKPIIGKNTTEKELLIHDALIKRANYDESEKTLMHNAYDVIVEKKGVCDAYSKAFQYLLRKVGITSYIISGNTDGDPHVWNIVNLDGTYYHVDITWDENNSGDDAFLQYQYFNISTKEIKGLKHVIEDDNKYINKCDTNWAGIFPKSVRNTWLSVNDIAGSIKIMHSKYKSKKKVAIFIDSSFSQEQIQEYIQKNLVDIFKKVDKLTKTKFGRVYQISFKSNAVIIFFS